eukprot:1511952-Rhodomonas_salina.2
MAWKSKCTTPLLADDLCASRGGLSQSSSLSPPPPSLPPLSRYLSSFSPPSPPVAILRPGIDQPTPLLSKFLDDETGDWDRYAAHAPSWLTSVESALACSTWRVALFSREQECVSVLWRRAKDKSVPETRGLACGGGGGGVGMASRELRNESRQRRELRSDSGESRELRIKSRGLRVESGLSRE